jgi:solute carrier family 9B (sodium/hydrogen exchanger), member 1/2
MSAALLGAVLAGVSPAVTVPMMLDFIARGKGRQRGVPSLVLAAAPLDNVVVVVLFSALAGAASATGASVSWHLLQIPVALATGAVAGLGVGWLAHRGFVRYDPRATKRALVVIAVAIILVSAEALVARLFPFSGLMAVMALGCVVLERSEGAAHEISDKLSKIWIVTEILLFVLIGATVDPTAVWRAGLAGAAVLLIGLCARSIGAYCCLLGTGLTGRERLFCVASGIPKATIQAAIGATPLAMGVAGGDLILAMAVLAIVVTAPLGAVLTRAAGEWALAGEVA